MDRGGVGLVVRRLQGIKNYSRVSLLHPEPPTRFSQPPDASPSIPLRL